MVIGIDMMGGDYAPAEAIKGVKSYLETSSPLPLCLVGDEKELNPLLEASQINTALVQVQHAGEVIGMHEHPTRALKEKPNSSISVGFGLLAKNQPIS